ncbi:MAG: DNA-directed RNA polymerase subunit beta' [Caldisericales bacterium]|nr:DNA-directed RNA polymerase subunit beta' [Caldisericales bacterium]
MDKNSAVQIILSSAEEIRSWSHGEVKKSETISYRNFKPEPDGLFCEKIFGPVKDYECRCGKFKGARYKGVICDRCGVEVTINKVRRERFGHIELAAPVVHTWYLKTMPYIALLLKVTGKVLEKITYFINYVVVDPGNAPNVQKMQLLTDEEYRELRRKYSFKAKKGAEAILDLIGEINLEKLNTELYEELASGSAQRKAKAIKRLDVVQAFNETSRSPINMILEVIPVIPPDLRPLLQLDGGRFATSDLNDLYQRVINRNTRLKKLMEVKAPDIMIQNEKRMLQESVDALFDNSKRDRPILGTANRPLKSLSDILKGKEGRFRQNLLGKRVDYSGRSVIVVNPNLKIDQCGLPKEMALELFKPFVMEGLVRTGFTQSLRQARSLIEQQHPEVYRILSEVVKGHPVLLNRAPTLHRLGIEAFDPILVEGKALQIPPLVCPPFNADFDGDQMAVHVPLTVAAQMESRLLMLSSRSILSPASGQPIIKPIQDIVLGCYYISLENDTYHEKKIYDSYYEVNAALNAGLVNLHDRINFRIPKGEGLFQKGKTVYVDDLKGLEIKTSVGRVVYNGRIREALEKSITHRAEVARIAGDDKAPTKWNLPFFNELMAVKMIQKHISECFRLNGPAITAELLDIIKEIGYEMSTQAGVTIALSDMKIPPQRNEIIKKAEKEVDKITEYFDSGLISDDERYQAIVTLWTGATDDIKGAVFANFGKFDSVHMMANSGARGSAKQINQMVGMRGLMTDPTNKIIEFPIKSNLREGLTVLEYFMSTHGSRKGLADTALRTSDSGYLTRRLVDVSHDIIVREYDCSQTEIYPIVIANKVVKPISKQAVGKIAIEDIVNPETGEVIIGAGQTITWKKAQMMDEANIKIARVKTSIDGVVYTALYDDKTIVEQLGDRIIGRIAIEDILAYPSKMVSVDDESAVGEILAHDIVRRGKVLYERGNKITKQTVKTAKTIGLDKLAIATGEPRVIVKAGQMVDERAVEEINESGIFQVRMRSPLTCQSTEGVCALCYGRDLSSGNLVNVGEAVGIVAAQSIGEPGTQLTLQTFHTGGVASADITTGLPRVEELFEARKPKGEAPVTEISGKISIDQGKDMLNVIVTSKDGAQKTYEVPYTSQLLVQNNEEVEAGTPITEGSLNPHELLRIKGVMATQSYLIEAIQKVYKSQGVDINDKHVEIIIRQLLRRIKIKDSGDSRFLPGETADKQEIEEENRYLIAQNKKPATFEPILQRVTKSAITSESFLSAASFQETPRVLAEAAVKGKIDPIHGLKEAVIVGQLIPAGTGTPCYLGMVVETKEETPFTDQETTTKQQD